MNNTNSLNLANDRIVTTTITHELKTPLNAIMGFTELILEEDCISKIKNYADIIKDNSKVLLEKIHKVIDYNTLELDSSIFIERVEIDDILIRGAKIMREEFGRCGVEFQIANKTLYLDSNSVIYTDRGKLEKLFCLLISSATYLSKSREIFMDYSLTTESFIFSLSFDQVVINDEGDHGGCMLEEGVGINIALCDKLAKHVGGKMSLQFDSTPRVIQFDLPFRNRYRDSKVYSAQQILLVVDDDDESFAKIKRMIPAPSFLLLRTTENCFINGVSESLSRPNVILINAIDTGEELKEAVRRVRESNPETIFLINLTNINCIEAFSHNYQNVLWFRSSTLKSQIERLLNTNHIHNCNERS